MMEKESVLVHDNKGVFLKMFKRRFKEEFNFFEIPFLSQKENDTKDFNRSIYVVYDKSELIEFVKLNKKETKVLVCLFNKQLYDSLSFLEELKDLILLDGSKTRIELVKELKMYFGNQSEFIPQQAEMKYPASNSIQTQFNNFYKTLFFLM